MKKQKLICRNKLIHIIIAASVTDYRSGIQDPITYWKYPTIAKYKAHLQDCSKSWSDGYIIKLAEEIEKA